MSRLQQLGGSGGSGGSGDPGPPGADGNTVLYGTIDPASGVGVDGNFYINKTSWTIFGPKATGAWPAGVSLIGPTGAAGTNGSNGTNGTNGSNGTNGFSVLNGSGAPGGGTGVNGDFYVDTTAWAIYGPKAGGSWGSGMNLVGPTGLTGAAGSNGTNGTNGSPGSPGAPGSAGPGVPTGGGSGQALVKNSATDYDTVWVTLTKTLVGLSNVDDVSEATILAAAATAGNAAYQAINAHLTDIAGLSPANGDFIQYVTANYVTRTPAQTKTALALKWSDTAPTPIAKTANYTALAGDFVICDTTTGTFTVTLPTTPADKSIVVVKPVTLAASTVVTVACGGSAVFNKAGGSTSGNLSRQSQASLYQYQASGDIWYVLATDPAITGGIPYYGTGADGNVTVSGTTTLTADMNYNNLTVSGTLITANYRVRVAGTLSGAGTIQNDGPGAGIANVALSFYSASGAGMGGRIASPNDGAVPSANNAGMGGAGGAGGGAGANVGGASLSPFAITASGGGPASILINDPVLILLGRPISASIGGGAGGSSGALSSGTQTAPAGAGGCGGGVCFVAARTITFTGLISAKGFNGQAATGTTGGGGGGGGGGFLIIGTASALQTFTTSVAAGTGGAGSGAGIAGSSGTAGRIAQFLGLF